MNPSSAFGRARGASAFRRQALFAPVVVFALACSHHAPLADAQKSGRSKQALPLASANTAPSLVEKVPEAAPPSLAMPMPRSPAFALREGGTGTRARGEQGALGAPSPHPRGWRTDAAYAESNGAGASQPAPARPQSPKPRATAGNAWGAGIGHGRLAARNAPAPADLDTEGYAPLVENPFLAVSEHPLSTFSSDVDTASYSNARRFLGEGRLPPQDSVRIEEWLNYFAYGYAPPAGDAPVAIRTELSDCPWSPSHRLVRIGITSRPIEQANTPPRNLVFLIDVSGSMMPANKLPLLKRGLSLLTRTLRPEDHVAMVVYAGSSGLVLPSTSGEDQDKILDALDALEAGGSTNGGQGIELAYRVAQEHFQKNGINRVVLATDGDFNVGTTSEGELARLIEDKRKTGVFLTVLGFGEGNVKDSTMEMLADKGNGNYAYVDSLAEARKVLVREAGSTLVTVAKDVKLQTEFNPARVQSYRLIGYENRLLADQDFNDDAKDAGDMGAGHSVTALYEVVPVGAPAPSGQAPAVSPLKYQNGASLAPAAKEPELLTVSVRYKAPLGNTSEKIASVVVDRPVPFASASADHRFAVAVAEFGQILRGSKAVGRLGLEQARQTASTALGADAAGERRELVALIERAARISGDTTREPLVRAE
ncbi:MAG TPA: von Willebrand factor type A domain-containing protein [Polyangiaceae bacterium]|nr:von Willebrand factor type A domain-containing protein [Polyangiaceae bacterium]